MFRRFLNGLAVVILGSAFFASGPVLAEEAAQDAAAGPDTDRILVRVNGEPIYESELNRAYLSRIPNVTGHANLSRERAAAHQRELLSELVVRRLILQAARKAGITVSDEEVDREAERLRARFSDREGYERAIARQGLDEAKVLEGLREHLLGAKMEQRIMDRVARPTQEQLRAYFEENPEKFRIPPRASLSYVLVQVAADATKAEWEAAQRRLEPLVQRVRGGEPFAEVAAEAAREEGVVTRDLGQVHQGQAPFQELDKVAFTLQAGQVSDPVWTLYGYAVVFVSEREEARDLAFEELNLELFEREWMSARRKEARAAWIDELVADATIESPEQ